MLKRRNLEIGYLLIIDLYLSDTHTEFKTTNNTLYILNDYPHIPFGTKEHHVVYQLFINKP